MTKYGLGTLGIIFIFAVIMLTGAYVTGKTSLILLSVLSGIFFIFSCYFFRDPARIISKEKDIIVSPADGTIIAISEENEPFFFKGKVLKISIFMSVFNVHVNRIPMEGTVTFFKYLRGKFYPAFKPAASVENEQSIIAIENASCKILFKQIAGILARRIVCQLREGHQVKRGDRFGMIKFGSRVDIFLPLDVQIRVKLNDKVKGGETIIGKIK